MCVAGSQNNVHAAAQRAAYDSKPHSDVVVAWLRICASVQMALRRFLRRLSDVGLDV